MIPANPKDVIGSTKVSLSTVPAQVLIAVFGRTWFSSISTSTILEVALGMSEGAIKYGKHNYRSEGVRASIYYDAFMRHMLTWKDGELFDHDSGLAHTTKALCSTIVFRDAMLQENWIDDRPIASKSLAYVRSDTRMTLDESAAYFYSLWFEGVDSVHIGGVLDGDKHPLDLVIQNLFAIKEEQQQSELLTVAEANKHYAELKQKHKDCGKHYDRHSVQQRKFAATPIPINPDTAKALSSQGWDQALTPNEFLDKTVLEWDPEDSF